MEVGTEIRSMLEERLAETKKQVKDKYGIEWGLSEK